jgi:demethylmenaquinone methyltransferase/2-methoxy-6-polyprenyl-1,4-benzoquinol methylase
MNAATATETTEDSDQTTVDKSGQRVRRMFGEISSRYDFMNHFLSGGVDYFWRWVTVRTIPPTGDAPILDVCTGTGDLAFSWWKKAGGRVAVIGTDFTPEMLQLANEKRDRKKIGENQQPITFLEADTQQLPFPADHFQIVSVAFGLRNVSDTDAGLKEMIRVCKPGGSVVVLEFSLPKNRVFRSAYLWYFKNVLPKLGQLLARNKQSAYNYLPDSVSEFPYGKVLADRMQMCGLETVKWKALTFGISTLYYGRKPPTESPTA